MSSTAGSIRRRTLLAIATCYTGDLKTGEKVLQPLRAFGSPIADVVAPHPFTAWQQVLDPLLTPGMRNYWKSHNLTTLQDGLLDAVIASVEKLPSPQCEIFFGAIGGATTVNAGGTVQAGDGGTNNTTLTFVNGLTFGAGSRLGKDPFGFRKKVYRLEDLLVCGRLSPASAGSHTLQNIGSIGRVPDRDGVRDGVRFYRAYFLRSVMQCPDYRGAPCCLCGVDSAVPGCPTQGFELLVSLEHLWEKRTPRGGENRMLG